ncbi:hypothetical protein VZT92_012321 [Zoarces viviparus]|uniref:Uncharacterized protein n=1 Tax=Zoarces viviparus TaxID=48416 RepID=A0AAW1F8B2_ZOAVI
MDEPGDGSQNTSTSSRVLDNYIFIDLLTPGFIFPASATGDRNYVGFEGLAEFVINHGVSRRTRVRVRHDPTLHTGEEIDQILPNHVARATRNNFNNDNMNNIVNIDNNDNINNDNVDDNAYNRNLDNNYDYAVVADPYREWEEIRWWDEFAEGDTDFDEETETSPIEHAKVPEDDPLPGPSKKRKRKTNRVEEDRSCKKVRWWDESAESSTDFNKETETSPIEHAKVPEDDPLPGASKKRKRKTNRVEEDRSCKKVRWWDESAESSTDFNKETETSPIEHAKVPEDDPLPGPSKKRKRKTNRVEEDRSCKKVRWWDESAESSTDFNKETETSPIEHAKVPEDDPLPGPSKKRKRKTNRVEEDRSCKKVRWWDESAESSTDFNKETETSPIEHAKVPEDDPLPGPSKKRKRKTNRVEEDRSCKKVRWWDESAESSTDFNKETETSPIEHAKVPEDDPLPGPSKKRKRKTNRVEEDRSCKKVRWWDESAESSTDFNKETETSPIEHAKVPEDDPLPGASKKRKRTANPLIEGRPRYPLRHSRPTNRVEEERTSKKTRRWDESAESSTDFNKETETSPIEHAKVPVDNPLPGASKKRKRKTDRVEEERPSKKVRWWDESAESSTDFNKETETSPIEHAKVPVDNPLPGASKKRKRKTDRVEEERPSKKVRWWDESAESSTDFNKETETSPIEHAKVPEDDPLPGASKKRKRKTTLRYITVI